MPVAGHTWSRRFPAAPEQAREVRLWVRESLQSTGFAEVFDAVFLANELFTAVLQAEDYRIEPGLIVMTLTTGGQRVRLYAMGTKSLPIHATHGPWRQIAGAVATARGDDQDRTIWAQLDSVQPESDPAGGRGTGDAATGGTT